MSDDSHSFEHEEARQEAHDLEDIEREEQDDAVEEEETAFKNNDEGINENDDGEDDDDDEEDEDDDDDRVRSRKRSRLERNRFLDVEAEVSDDDEDEDEDEDDLTKEGFIAADHENEAETLRRDDRLHRQVDRTHEKSTEEDAQRLAAEFKERYGRTNKYRGDESGFVSQRFLLPSINDPSIWAVRCRQGKEKEIVRKLLQKKLTLDGKPNALKILSAFQRDNFPNYIYIEADKLTAVDAAIKGFPDIYGSQKLLVPVEEFPDLLRIGKSSEVKVAPGGYVRIKRGKYKGDLAVIDAVEENGLEVTLQIVPRIDYKGQLDEETGKRKRVSAAFRPPQRLFSKKDALEFDPENLIVRSSNTFTYKGEEYIDGFLYKLFKLQFLETQNVKPKLDEVSRFNTGEQDQLDLTSIAQSLKASRTIVFNTGDRVQVLQGEQQGLQGDVISSSNDTILVKPRDFQGENLEIPINHLRKIFHEGDHVSVLSGKHTGHTGIVVSVKEDQVTFISDQSQKDVTVFANHLTKSTDSSTLVDGAYNLHDLVRINQIQVGVVINADKDVLTILSQEGKVLSLAPSAIVSKIEQRKDQVFSTDSNGDAIKLGDTVKENQGFKRQGSILHIYRSIIFVYSKETAENSGIFATDNLSVSNIASKHSIEKEGQGQQLDLTKMNPKLKSGGTMAPPSLPGQQTGRDRTINQYVSIRMGEYKGLRGIVKDANGDIARVELHTKNKILSISKQKLSFIINDQLIPYDEFIRTKTDFRNSGPTYSTRNGSSSSRSGGSSSHWAGSSSGSKTPAWQAPSGGRTSHGSGTSWGGATSHGNNTSWGAGTSYGAGTNYGGAGTAWGSSSAAGAGTSWGGQQSSWGAPGTGNASSYGAGSQWGGNGGSNTGYGGGSQWGRSSYGKPQQSWAAETPGSYQSAETPSANYTETPGAHYSAPTPGYPSAQTPGDYQ